MNRRAISFVLALSGVLVGCGRGSGPAAEPVRAKSAVASAGTEVRLILLRPIAAGSTREGTLLPFLVAEDVKSSDGLVVIEKGTIAEGEVTWSRSEGTLGGMMNRPARLAVRIRRTRAPGGETIELASEVQKPEEPFAFTRENTGLPQLAGVPGESRQAELADQVAAAMDEFLESGDATKLNFESEARDWLRQFNDQNQLSALNQSLDRDRSQLEKLVKHVRDGSITKLAGPDMVLAVAALQEMGRFAHSIERGVASKLKGRTIRAYVGTPVTAFVAKDTKVMATPQAG